MTKLLLSTAALCAISTSAFATVTVTSTPYGLAAPAQAAAVITFDQKLPAGFTLTGGHIQNVSNSMGAEPAGDSSDYLAANPGNTATLRSTTGYRDISLYWGSIDKYNTISLLGKNGKAIESFTGAQIFLPANGDQSAGSTNRRVTFTTDADSPIYGLEFQSGSPAFEVDNIAFSSPVRDCKPIGAVPEPASWAMMIGGLGLLGGSLRRSRKTGTMAALRA